MQDKEILETIASHPDKEYEVVDGSGRRFWAEVGEVERVEPADDYTVISARMMPTDGIDGTALLVGHLLQDSSWELNLHYFSESLPMVESVERVEMLD